MHGHLSLDLRTVKDLELMTSVPGGDHAALEFHSNRIRSFDVRHVD